MDMTNIFAKRRMLVLGLGILLANSIVGCGSASGSNTMAGSQSGGSTPSTTSPTSTAPSQTHDGAGATITQPFSQTVSGAQCYVGQGDDKGKAAFGFPKRQPTSDATLAFTLGPLTDGSSPGQEHNAPYTGAGTYTNIGIFVQPPSGLPVAGFGTVIVNADRQTGSFQMGSAAGTWNCGSPVTP
jgi:hypothetical protein